MSIRPDATDDGPRVPGVDEGAWQRQEAAMRAQRADAHDARASDPRDARIARALATPVDAPLPSNFAYVQAQRIEAIVAERRRADARFMRRLKLGFALGYGGAVAATLLAFRRELFDWVDQPAMAAVVGSPWWPWLAACAGGVLALQWWSRRAARRAG